MEEERVPQFSPQTWFPVRIGDTLKRYQVLFKLGYGSYATVWLSRDLETKKYVALKIYNRSEVSRLEAFEEVKMLDRIARVDPVHEGRKHIRLELDRFAIQTLQGTWFVCIVYEPLGMSLWRIREELGTGLTEEMAKKTVREVLQGLDYLHSVAGVVHAGSFPSSKHSHLPPGY